MDFNDNTFLCKCDKGFSGDGISCLKIIEKVEVRIEKELDCKHYFYFFDYSLEKPDVSFGQDCT